MSYQLSNSFKTLNHWQSGRGGGSRQWDTLPYNWGSCIGLVVNNVDYPFPPYLEFPDVTDRYIRAFTGFDEIIFASPYDFTNQQAIAHFKELLSGKVVYVGAFDAGTVEMSIGVLNMSSTRTVVFTGNSMALPDPIYQLPVGQTSLTVPCSVPEIQRVGLMYAWVDSAYDGVLNDMPSWVWTGATGSISSVQYWSVNGYDTFTDTDNIFQGPPVVGLTDALLTTASQWYKRPLIPRGTSLLQRNDVNSNGSVRGFNSSPRAERVESSVFPGNETGFVVDGQTTYYNNATYQRQLATQYIGVNEYDCLYPSLVRSGSSGFGVAAQDGIYPSIYLTGDTLTGARFVGNYQPYTGYTGSFQNFVEKRFYDTNGVQIGALYFTVINRLNRILIKGYQNIYNRT